MVYMKKFLLITAVIMSISSGSVMAQNVSTPTTNNPAVENKNTAATPAEKIALPDGYNELAWGNSLTDVKGKVQGKLIYSDDKNIIISRDDNIEYRYGFFTPASTDENVTPPEPRLFYVIIQYPYLSLADVKKKVEGKYGSSTGEDLKRNQGVVVWETPKTMLVIWVDNYKNNPYTRKISYISKEIGTAATAYQNSLFTGKEKKVLEKLNP